MGEFWSIGILAAGLVDENFVNAELAQQNFLSSCVLLLSADADISNLHGVSLL